MKMDRELVGPARGAGGTGRDGGTMSPFDRLQLEACLVRLRTAMDADAMATARGINGSRWRKIADRATVEIYEAVQALEAALDEIKRQAAIIRAAIDDVPGYPCGCSHELDQDGVVTAVHTTCEAHRRSHAQVQRLIDELRVIDRLTETAQGEGNHRLLLQIRDRARTGMIMDDPTETEGS